MKRLFLALTLLALIVGSAAAANFNLYNGTWMNPAPAPQAITKIEIGVVDSKAHVHAWGQLRPKKDYDWGWEPASTYTDGHLSVRYQNSLCTHDLTITLSGNRLVVKTHTRYTDGSVRDFTDRLNRYLQPSTQTTPTPMDPVHPKPVTAAPEGKY